MPSLPFDHAAQATLAIQVRSIPTVRCLITGCELSIPNATQHGDLFLVSDTWVFNAVGEPEYGGQLSEGRKALLVREGFHQNYFERRNVYVIPREEAKLNTHARVYVEGVL